MTRYSDQSRNKYHGKENSEDVWEGLLYNASRYPTHCSLLGMKHISHEKSKRAKATAMHFLSNGTSVDVSTDRWALTWTQCTYLSAMTVSSSCGDMTSRLFAMLPRQRVNPATLGTPRSMANQTGTAAQCAWVLHEARPYF